MLATNGGREPTEELNVGRFRARAKTLSRRLYGRAADREDVAIRDGQRRRSAPSERSSSRAGRSRRRSVARPGSHHQGRRQAVGPGEIQARAASVRRLREAERPGRQERSAEGRRQFPLALFRPVLLRADAEILYVPAAHSQRHSFASAVRGRRRSRRALCRRLRPCDHARQSANARGRAQKRRRHGRGDPGSRLKLARLRRRQYPQRHRHADRGDRSAGTDRYAALRPRMAFPHPQRPLALRHSAQVQCRLRRRRR